MILTDVWVPGLPKTKGSLTFRGNGYVEENVKGSARWRVLVAERVRADRRRRGLTSPSAGPVAVRALFWLPPAASPAPFETYAAVHTRSGDVDKLARNVLDALGANAAVAAKNGGAYVDDVQVVDLRAVKMLAGGLVLPPGLALTVWELTPALLAQDEGMYWMPERGRVERGVPTS